MLFVIIKEWHSGNFIIFGWSLGEIQISLIFSFFCSTFFFRSLTQSLPEKQQTYQDLPGNWFSPLWLTFFDITGNYLRQKNCFFTVVPKWYVTKTNQILYQFCKIFSRNNDFLRYWILKNFFPLHPRLATCIYLMGITFSHVTVYTLLTSWSVVRHLIPLHKKNLYQSKLRVREGRGVPASPHQTLLPLDQCLWLTKQHGDERFAYNQTPASLICE